MLQQKINLPSDFPTPVSYAYFGYGEPRVGNKAFADYFNQQKARDPECGWDGMWVKKYG